MKRSVLPLVHSVSISTCMISCNRGNQSNESQDSVAAAAAADSMLREATQEADTTVSVDSIIVDTTAADTPQ